MKTPVKSTVPGAVLGRLFPKAPLAEDRAGAVALLLNLG